MSGPFNPTRDPVHGFLFEGAGFAAKGGAGREGFVFSIWVRTETAAGARGLALQHARRIVLERWGEDPSGALRMLAIGRSEADPALERLDDTTWWTDISVHPDTLFTRLRQMFGQFRVRL